LITSFCVIGDHNAALQDSVGKFIYLCHVPLKNYVDEFIDSYWGSLSKGKSSYQVGNGLI